MTQPQGVNLWSTKAHALDYLRRADSIPHRVEGEDCLLECLPAGVTRILDLGSGAGRMIERARAVLPGARFVALDFSATMLDALQKAYGRDGSVTIIAHDFDQTLPEMGCFEAIVSSFAIHHLAHERKRALYREIFEIAAPGGVFCNLEHVASPTPGVHDQFLAAIGWPDEDPSNKLLDLETQLKWLREIGFQDVDCHWKWRELALLVGIKPA
ncbi:MAG TPA: class I SAM-dependent methyltransferase [Candidatus Acidoferrales bacterium]|jgi:tRNA (cmo5U34)-methyltransferase|nr:class I SAM-dependent methyltransferase [Candidatus Acidoferrales bacterium]